MSKVVMVRLQQAAHRLLQFIDVDAPPAVIAAEATLIWHTSLALEDPGAVQNALSPLIASAKATVGLCVEDQCGHAVRPPEELRQRMEDGRAGPEYDALRCEWCNLKRTLEPGEPGREPTT